MLSLWFIAAFLCMLIYYAARYLYHRFFIGRRSVSSNLLKWNDCHFSKIYSKKNSFGPLLARDDVSSLLELYGARHINAIVDQFRDLSEVSKALRLAGLESADLIIGKFNEILLFLCVQTDYLSC